jgi:hypothetical protein
VLAVQVSVQNRTRLRRVMGKVYEVQ